MTTPSPSAAEPAAPPERRRGLGGPTLVALGAGGWGTEGLWRHRLDQKLAAYPIVLFEHVLQVIFTLPWLLKNLPALKRVPRRALWYVLLSGGIGSSLGTVCYTAALGTDVNKAAAAVLLNLQPVVSTIAAAALFGEQIRRRFYPWAALAIIAGITMAIDDPSFRGFSNLRASPGFVYVGLTVVLWGFATVAGRGAMREMPLGLAAPLRLWAGLGTTALVIGLRYLAGKGGIDVAPLGDAGVWLTLLLLTTISGVLPLFIYFAGLATTPAALAGYCEMFYTVTATVLAWLFLPQGKLGWHQMVAAVVLVGAIVMLNRGQAATVEPPPPAPAPAPSPSPSPDAP